VTVTTALLALALAVPVGLYVLWPLLTRRPGLAATPADDTREALEVEKVQALQALRELQWDRQAGLLSDDDHAELTARYEARAASVLKRLDALGPAPAAPVPTGSAAARPAPSRRRVPWTQRPAVLTGGAVVVLLFGVVLGALAVRHTAPEPPAGPTGAGPGPMGPGPMPGPGPTPGGGERGPLPKAMLEGMLRAAHQALDAGQYSDAIAAYKAVLKRDPQNVDAITHLGVILAQAGHVDPALEAFDRALAIDPSYAHALWDKAQLLHDQRRDYAGAIAAWERFVAVGPPGPDRDQALVRIREARALLAAAPAGGPGPGTSSAPPKSPAPPKSSGSATSPGPASSPGAAGSSGPPRR
jgi:tetratricopeptide (TPR) repeat protein